MVKKTIKDLDLPKISGPDCIPVVVLKNCEPDLFHILAELFNKYLKKSCFPDCWKVSQVVPVFKNDRERSTAKNYSLVSLFSVISKVFKNLCIIELLITQRNVTIFLISCVVLGLLDQLQIFSQLYLIELLGLLKGLGLLELWHFIDRVWHAGLLHKLKSCRVSGQIFDLISCCLNNRQLRVVTHKNIQLMLEFLNSSLL